MSSVLLGWAQSGLGNEPALTSPWYTAFTVSIGAADLHETSHRDTIGTAQIIGDVRDGEIVHRADYDYVGGLGMSFGWQRANWRFETEALWRPRTDWDPAILTPSISTVTNVETNITNATLLANIARNFGQLGRWQFQAGAGIGVAFNHFKSRYKERAIPGGRDAFTSSASSSSQRLAWNFSLGVQRPWGQRWSSAIRYRYLDLGLIDAGPFPERPGTLRGRHSTHELQFTLIRRAQ